MDNLFAAIRNLQNVNPINSDSGNFVSGISVNDLKALEIFNKLNANDTLTGIISDISGDTATILLNQNVTISANLNADISLQIGSPVFFEVGKDNENTISLKPLFTNISNQNLAETALKEADVPLCDKSFSMLSEMIDKGLPIDKDSVSSLYRSVVSHPDIPVKEITLMRSIGLPVTDENIAKFDSVVHFQNKITDSISTLIDEVPKEFVNLWDNDVNSFLELTENLLTFEDDLSGNVGIDKGISSESDVLNGNVINKELNELTDDLKYESFIDDKLSLSSKSNEELSNLVKHIIDKESILEDRKYILNLSKEIISRDDISRDLKEMLVKSDVFKDALKETLSKEWLIKPEDFKDSDSINSRFDKIIKVCDNLTQNLQVEFKPSQVLTNALDNFRENMSFLENLNNLTPYIQIPMRMSGEANTGDLYVYAKKKNLLENKDNLSALLRLDMKHLGAVEVYVKLFGSKNLTTNFTFENEESLILAEKNIHILNEKLENKGFNVTNSFNKKSSAPMIFDEDKKRDDTDVIGLYKFDVRA